MQYHAFREEQFEPKLWWKNPHFQTLSRGFFRNGKKIAWERTRRTTPYGDSLTIDVYPAKGEARARLLALHGLTGCSHASPTPELAHKVSAHGVETWALNLRGADRLVPSVPRLYHAGCTEDLEGVFTQLPQDLPWRFLGFSLGANLLLKWLGEHGDRALGGSKAMGVSCPFDLKQCSASLERSLMTRFYRAILIFRLKLIMKKFSRAYPEVLSEKTIAACRTFYDIDQNITAPLHGFEGAEDYWARCSSRFYLESITVPTQILHAWDDSFQTKPPVHTKNPHLSWEVHDKGGHVGFQKSFQEDWLVERLARFVLSD